MKHTFPDIRQAHSENDKGQSHRGHFLHSLDETASSSTDWAGVGVGGTLNINLTLTADW